MPQIDVATYEVYRQMVHAALDQLHAAQQRIASLEAQLKAAREEIRRIIQAGVES